MVFIRGAYAYDRDDASAGAALEFPDPSLTQQQFAEDADINTIVRRFGLTGEMPEAFVMPQSGDFIDATSFEESMQLIVKAREEFMTLPADVRRRFANDPGQLIEFLEDGRNLDDARKLGLLKPPPEVTRDAVKAIDELAAKFPAPPGT